MPTRRIKFSDLQVKIIASDKFTKVLKLVNNSIRKFGKSASIATAAATGALALFVAKGAQTADATAKISRELGISTEQFLAFRNAAGFAGVETAKVEGALRKMQASIGKAQQGVKTYTDAFMVLGIETREFDNLDPAGALEKILEAANNLQNADFSKIAAIRDILGRNGGAILQVTVESIQAARREIDELGLAISDVDSANIEFMNDQVDRAKSVFNALAERITAFVAPAVSVLIEQSLNFVKAQGGIANVLDNVFTALINKIGNISDAFKNFLEGLPLLEIEFGGVEEEERRLKNQVKALGDELNDIVNAADSGGFGGFLVSSIPVFERLNAEAEQLKRLELKAVRAELLSVMEANDAKPSLLENLRAKMSEVNMEAQRLATNASGVNQQATNLLDALNTSDSGSSRSVPFTVEPDISIDTAKVDANLAPLQEMLSARMTMVANDVGASIPSAFAGAQSLLVTSLEQVAAATGTEAAQAASDAFNEAIGALAINNINQERILSAEELCQKAKETGDKAATCLGDAFKQKLENFESILGSASSVLGGLDSLLQANETNEMARIERAKTRNATELDILKTRLSNAKNVSQNEIALYNKQVSSINARNSALDIAAAAAEQKACKRAKKFAILQGAIAVAAAWSAAAKAGSFAAGAGPIAFFAGFGSVLAAGLGAAAQIAKFDCNKIGSTSGGAGGGGGGGGFGNSGGISPPTNTAQQAGADLQGFDPNRGRPQRVVNITVNGDRISTDDVIDIVQQINEGESQINVDRVAGVF